MAIDWDKDPNDMVGATQEDKMDVIIEADEIIKKMRREGAPKSETDRLQAISNEWYERWNMEVRGREQNPAQ